MVRFRHCVIWSLFRHLRHSTFFCSRALRARTRCRKTSGLTEAGYRRVIRAMLYRLRRISMLVRVTAKADEAAGTMAVVT